MFNGAPDLLDEFKQFLPDITGQPASALFGDEQSSYYGDSIDGASVTTGKRGVGQQKKKRGPVISGTTGKVVSKKKKKKK